MKALLALVAMLICSSFATAQTQMSDKRLMSDAEFRTSLSQVEAILSTLETQLKGIDLDKVPQISYSRGKSIEAQRNLGLMEIDTARKQVSKLRVKRSVSGELALEDVLNTFFWSVAEMESAEDFASLTHYDNKSELEWGMLVSRIGSDVQARVEMLEKGTCQ
jgi:exonuclease VII small subunit